MMSVERQQFNQVSTQLRVAATDDWKKKFNCKQTETCLKKIENQSEFNINPNI